MLDWEKLAEWMAYFVLFAFSISLTNIVHDQYNFWGFVRWAGETMK